MKCFFCPINTCIFMWFTWQSLCSFWELQSQSLFNYPHFLRTLSFTHLTVSKTKWTEWVLLLNKHAQDGASNLSHTWIHIRATSTYFQFIVYFPTITYILTTTERPFFPGVKFWSNFGKILLNMFLKNISSTLHTSLEATENKLCWKLVNNCVSISLDVLLRDKNGDKIL